MNTIQKPAKTNWNQAIALVIGILCALPATAGLREPDAVVWGTIVLNQTAIAAANTDVSVEARRTPTGAAIAAYQMGGNASAGDFYTLRLIVESGLPLTDPNAVLSGDTIYLVVKNSAGDQDSKQIAVAGRGTISRVDFGSLDTNGNGILDDWETRYFGALGVDPNADPDGDGASNLREFQEGTNPKVADARHPADRDVNDGRIGINEVTSYGLAWRNNLTWPVGPVPIPISYVTKAGALWKGGELYKLDTNIAPTAPLWWTNVPIAGLTVDATKKAPKAEASAPSQITRLITASPLGGYLIELDVTPATNVAAFAIEEQIPVGWNASDISDGGGLSSAQNLVRWGLFLDATQRQLKYRLSPIGSPAGSVKFAGLASFDGQDITTGGALALPDGSGAISLALSAQTGAAGTILTIHGLPGQNVSIESSTNLTDWTALKGAALGAFGTVDIPIDSTTGSEFFRARAISAQ